MARYLPGPQPQDFRIQLAFILGSQALHLGDPFPVLLDDVGTDMVPAAPHTHAWCSPEGSLHHRSWGDYCRPYLYNQQTVPRLAAAYLGPDASRHCTDWRLIVPSTLARSGAGRSSPRLHGRASVGERQTHDERRLRRTRPDNTSIDNASPATNQSRVLFREEERSKGGRALRRF